MREEKRVSAGCRWAQQRLQQGERFRWRRRSSKEVRAAARRWHIKASHSPPPRRAGSVALRAGWQQVGQWRAAGRVLGGSRLLWRRWRVWGERVQQCSEDHTNCPPHLNGAGNPTHPVPACLSLSVSVLSHMSKSSHPLLKLHPLT